MIEAEEAEARQQRISKALALMDAIEDDALGGYVVSVICQMAVTVTDTTAVNASVLAL